MVGEADLQYTFFSVKTSYIVSHGLIGVVIWWIFLEFVFYIVVSIDDDINTRFSKDQISIVHAWILLEVLITSHC